jgi:hypothetical protein
MIAAKHAGHIAITSHREAQILFAQIGPRVSLGVLSSAFIGSLRGDSPLRQLPTGFASQALPGNVLRLDHPVLFPKEDEVAGIWDHGKLGVGDAFEGLNGVVKADKIVISEKTAS